jgi:tetratricopeptide (TPR) repeat protein
MDKFQLKHADRTKAEIEKITATMKLEPKAAVNFYYRGQLYNNLKQYEESIADFSEAIKLNPQYLNAYLMLSSVQRSTHFATDDIIKEFRPALKMVLTNGIDCLHRATAEYTIGFKEEAITDLKKALRFKPSANVTSEGMKASEPGYTIVTYQQLIYMLKQTGRDDESIAYKKELHAKYPDAR